MEKPPRLVMTLLVRDEADILETHLDYHLGCGVDHILAMDNCSVDQTADILRSYEATGQLTYFYQPEDNYAQAQWVTEMARIAFQDLGADWVIPSDADEFWWPAAGDLRTVLAAVDRASDAVLVDRVNFIPPIVGDEGHFADIMTLREAHATNLLGRPLLPKICHRAGADIEVEQGNHSASKKGHPLPATSAPLEILHFPVRSYSQFANKIACGGAAYQRNESLPPEIGVTWRRMYELYLRGELKSYFDHLSPKPADVAEGLRNGQLVRDERLRNFVFARRQELAPTLT